MGPKLRTHSAAKGLGGEPQSVEFGGKTLVGGVQVGFRPSTVGGGQRGFWSVVCRGKALGGGVGLGSAWLEGALECGGLGPGSQQAPRSPSGQEKG